MSDLILDIDELKDLYLDLVNVRVSFGSIDEVSKSVADVVGHGGLEKKVRDFATKWDDRRDKIVTSLDALSESARSVATTFQDVDRGMGDALSQRR